MQHNAAWKWNVNENKCRIEPNSNIDDEWNPLFVVNLGGDCVCVYAIKKCNSKSNIELPECNAFMLCIIHGDFGTRRFVSPTEP